MGYEEKVEQGDQIKKKCSVGLMSTNPERRRRGGKERGDFIRGTQHEAMGKSPGGEKNIGESWEKKKETQRD